jgi:hypothetical protein
VARPRLLLVALVCAGCGTADPAPVAAPAEFTAREPLAACPAQDLGQGDLGDCTETVLG